MSRLTIRRFIAGVVLVLVLGGAQAEARVLYVSAATGDDT